VPTLAAFRLTLVIPEAEVMEPSLHFRRMKIIDVSWAKVSVVDCPLVAVTAGEYRKSFVCMYDAWL